MSHQPFSVAISVYKNDNPKFFDRALESITDLQTIKPDEIVLVIDGPVQIEIDNVISKYSSRYNFKIIRFEKNCGLGNALKSAIESSSYELIARMDSDDVAKNDRFEQQLKFFESNPSIDVVGSNISEFIDDEHNIIGYRNVPKSNNEIRKYIKKRCPFNHMTVMFRKTSVIKSGGYIELHYNEDYYLWIRMFQNDCLFANMHGCLVNVRVSKNTYARRGGYDYYKSEIALQKYMRKNRIIGYFTYLGNCAKRFIVQILMPNKLRGFVFRKIGRSSIKEGENNA